MATTGRISQLPVEAIRDPDPKARLTQEPVEAVRDTAPTARVSQLPVEVVRHYLDQAAVVSQLPVEVVREYIPPPLMARVSQLPVEVLSESPPAGTFARISQEPVEVLSAAALSIAGISYTASFGTAALAVDGAVLMPSITESQGSVSLISVTTVGVSQAWIAQG